MKTLKERIEIMQACLDGKEIEVLRGNEMWVTINDPSFEWKDTRYRIKPEPMVIWCNVYNDGMCGIAYTSKADAKLNADYSLEKTIKKFIEVIE